MPNNAMLTSIKKLVDEANVLASSLPNLKSGFQTEVKATLSKPLTEEEQYCGEIKDILTLLQKKLRNLPY